MLLMLLSFCVWLVATKEGFAKSDTDAPVDESLLLDDACLTTPAHHGQDHGQDDCALNALQTHKSTSTSLVSQGRFFQLAGSPWKKKDISIALMKKIKHNIHQIQPQVVELWNGTQHVKRAAERMVAQVDSATGSDLDPRQGNLIQVRSFAGRPPRRTKGVKTLPKRTKYVMRLLIYLQKELVSVKAELTQVSRLRNAVENKLLSMPHGPTMSLQRENSTPKKDQQNPDGIPLGESHSHMVKRVLKEIIKDIKGTGKGIDRAAKQVRQTQLKVDAWILKGSKMMNNKKGKRSGEGKVKGKGKGNGKDKHEHIAIHLVN